jgi:hypothetical protein
MYEKLGSKEPGEEAEFIPSIDEMQGLEALGAPPLPDGVDEKELLKRKFTPTQLKILKLKRRNPNLTNSEIARILEVTPQAVHMQFSAKELAGIVAWMERDNYAKLDYLRGMALDKTKQLLETSKDEYISLGASKMVLEGFLKSPGATPKQAPIDDVIFSDSSQPDEPEQKV